MKLKLCIGFIIQTLSNFSDILKIIPIVILLIISYLLDWAYYQDIEKVSIGLGISFILMVISYFLFNLISNCTESKEKKKRTVVAKDKIKFIDS